MHMQLCKRPWLAACLLQIASDMYMHEVDRNIVAHDATELHRVRVHKKNRVTMIAQRTAYIQHHRLHSCHWNEKKTIEQVAAFTSGSMHGVIVVLI
jgi:hypothetical protein